MDVNTAWQDTPARPDPSAPDADAAQQKDGPPPTLAQVWEAGLLAQVLDPDKPIVQTAAAGMGEWFDRTLGGGLQPGNMIGLVTATAGGGKTAFAHQLSDGLAMASAIAFMNRDAMQVKPKVTPVIFVTEMRVEDVTLRTLARESERPGYILRAPRGREASKYPAGSKQTFGEESIAAALVAAQRFKHAARFITIMDRRARLPSGTAAIGRIQDAAAAVRRHWESQGADVTAVFVVVDPLHRLVDQTVSETEALGDVLSSLLDVTHADGLITLFSSDTTKSASALRSAETNDLEQQAEQAFRGSYQLLHMPDFAYALRLLDPVRHESALEKSPVAKTYFARNTNPDWGTTYADLISPKLRWQKIGQQPAFWFDGALFRFVPISEPA